MGLSPSAGDSHRPEFSALNSELGDRLPPQHSPAQGYKLVCTSIRGKSSGPGESERTAGRSQCLPTCVEMETLVWSSKYVVTSRAFYLGTEELQLPSLALSCCQHPCPLPSLNVFRTTGVKISY